MSKQCFQKLLNKRGQTMTTIKMNDGRTQYDVKEDYYKVRDDLQMLTQSFIELTDTQLGKVLLNVNNILSVRATNNV